MSHLTILPTVLRDTSLLAAALADLGLSVHSGGQLRGFGPDRQAVCLRAQLPGGLWIGWRRQFDGSLALVADLQRLSRSQSVQQLLGEITRRYAARLALLEASRDLPTAAITLQA